MKLKNLLLKGQALEKEVDHKINVFKNNIAKCKLDTEGEILEEEQKLEKATMNLDLRAIILHTQNIQDLKEGLEDLQNIENDLLSDN